MEQHRRTISECTYAFQMDLKLQAHAENAAPASKHYYDRVSHTPMQKAKQLIRTEVRAGRMPRANTHGCTDCHAPATCYDHRDYHFPLRVEPVCSSCNKKRGPGKHRGF